ncbi:MAG: hypothetical protein F6K41_37820 [Symploca sp. SIO3E6]|nr:hypothetical protein [Caldora sp. SIO3E6]
MKKFFTTMHESSSLRVPASPRPRVSFKSGGRRKAFSLLPLPVILQFVKTYQAE